MKQTQMNVFYTINFCMILTFIIGIYWRACTNPIMNISKNMYMKNTRISKYISYTYMNRYNMKSHHIFGPIITEMLTSSKKKYLNSADWYFWHIFLCACMYFVLLCLITNPLDLATFAKLSITSPKPLCSLPTPSGYLYKRQFECYFS